MNASDRACAAMAADLLAHGRTIHALSAALMVVAIAALPVLALLLASPLVLALVMSSVILGIAEMWFALRVAFDARIFARMAQGGTGDGLDAAAFDTAMIGLGLMPADKAGRPVAIRVRGAIGLLARQAVVLILQVALLIASGWLLALMRD